MNSFLLLGSNMGDSRQILEAACTDIEESAGRIIKRSSLYESEPWGFEHKNNFLNRVVQIHTMHEPEKLLDVLLKIELEHGRKRKSAGYEARPIDIDILFYEERIVQTEKLCIPHPLIQDRRFTLEPLCEIAPALFHPVLKKTISQLLNECSDNLQVKRITG